MTAQQAPQFAEYAVEPRRALGAYYTPADIAYVIAAWALRNNCGPVLDPSYGVCRFLEAAIDILARSGEHDAVKLVDGVDLDVEQTRETTDRLCQRGAAPEQFRHVDFFTLEPQRRYAAVIGNPPYVRHHWQTPDGKANVARALATADVSLSRRASLWAPFVLHADRFVRSGGRMAMLLPGSALQAGYATPIWSRIACCYRQVTLMRVGERLWADAQEETILLLADGRGEQRARAVLVAEIKDFATAGAVLDSDPELAEVRKRGRQVKRTRQGLTDRRLLARALEHERCSPLADLAAVRLGTVTGANRFFLRTAEDPVIDDLPAALRPTALARSGWLNGTAWRSADADAVRHRGERSELLQLEPGCMLTDALTAAVIAGEKEGLHDRSHCRQRKQWWALGKQPVPDAFLAYAMARPKGLVSNSAGTPCINGVHRIDWHDGIDGLSYIASSWTALWAVAIEQTGRHYAGGVLKIEPGAAARIPLVRCEEPPVLDQLDSLLRAGRHDEARQFADEAILQRILGFSPAQCRTLGQIAEELAERRKPPIRRQS